MSSCGYVGKGKVYLDGRFVGNVSALNIAITEEKLEQTNYTTGGGGNCAVVRRIDAVELSLTMTAYDADNLALAVFGTSAADAGGSVTDEAQTSAADADTEDRLVVTDKLIDTSIAVTVTGTGGTPSYVEGTDFTVGVAGVTTLASGSIGASTALEISYTAQGTNVVQALVSSPAKYQVTFEGLNEADSGAAVVVKAHSVQFGPSEDMAFIADDFAELAITGDILLDDTVVGAGLSQYFTIAAA